MPLCPSCGLATANTDICIHHVSMDPGSNWAAGNRTWCDFFHRGIVAPDDETIEDWFFRCYGYELMEEPPRWQSADTQPVPG